MCLLTVWEMRTFFIFFFVHVCILLLVHNVSSSSPGNIFLIFQLFPVSIICRFLYIWQQFFVIPAFPSVAKIYPVVLLFCFHFLHTNSFYYFSVPAFPTIVKIYVVLLFVFCCSYTDSYFCSFIPYLCSWFGYCMIFHFFTIQVNFFSAVVVLLLLPFLWFEAFFLGLDCFCCSTVPHVMPCPSAGLWVGAIAGGASYNPSCSLIFKCTFCKVCTLYMYRCWYKAYRTCQNFLKEDISYLFIHSFL